RGCGIAVVDRDRSGEAAEVHGVGVGAGPAVDDHATAGGGCDGDEVGARAAVDGRAPARVVDIILRRAVGVDDRIRDARAVDRLGDGAAPGDLTGRLADDVGGAAVAVDGKRVAGGVATDEGNRRGQRAAEGHRKGVVATLAGN